MNTNKGSVGTIVAAVLALIIIGGIYYITQKNKSLESDSTKAQEETSGPALTQSEAEALVLKYWGGCTPDTCKTVTVTVKKEGSDNIVTAIYTGMKDDSISAAKSEAVAEYKDGKWTLGKPTDTFSCQKDRGHQDFSDSPCI